MAGCAKQSATRSAVRANEPTSSQGRSGTPTATRRDRELWKLSASERADGRSCASLAAALTCTRLVVHPLEAVLFGPIPKEPAAEAPGGPCRAERSVHGGS